MMNYNYYECFEKTNKLNNIYTQKNNWRMATSLVSAGQSISKMVLFIRLVGTYV